MRARRWQIAQTLVFALASHENGTALSGQESAVNDSPCGAARIESRQHPSTILSLNNNKQDQRSAVPYQINSSWHSLVLAFLFPLAAPHVSQCFKMFQALDWLG